MHKAKMKFFCPKCKQVTDVNILSVRAKEVYCYHCNEIFSADNLLKSLFRLSKELHKLFKKHANISCFTRVEFERDYKLSINTLDFFFSQVKDCQDKDEYHSGFFPRFDIVAYQFKCKYSSVRMLLHDDSISYPQDYLIPASFSFSYKFSEIIEKPFLSVSQRDVRTKRNNEFAKLHLFDYADLVHYTKLYNAYLRAFSKKHQCFACFQQ